MTTITTTHFYAEQPALTLTVSNTSRLREIEDVLTANPDNELMTLDRVLDGVLDLTTINKKEINKLCDIFDVTTQIVNSRIKHIKKNQIIKNKLGAIPEDEYSFVNIVLNNWNAKISISEKFTVHTPYVWNNKIISQHDFSQLPIEDQRAVAIADPHCFDKHTMHSRLIKEAVISGLKYNDNQLNNALQDWVYTKKNELKASMLGLVSFNKHINADDAWLQLARSISNDKPEMTAIVLKHFVWQVKRKIHQLSVQNHLMPVLFGAQGGGKTEFIAKFIKPLKDFSASTSFSEVVDERNITLWDYSVLVFDEMSGASKSDINAVKSAITQTTFTRRYMATNNSTQVENRATFIGSTNIEVSDIIKDNTGMRRFYQINCLPTLDWDLINHFDKSGLFLKLWQSVNENIASPLVSNPDLMSQLTQSQNALKTTTPVYDFLDNYYHNCVDNNVTTKTVQVSILFDEFKEYYESANSGNAVNITLNSFSRQVTGQSVPPNIKLESKRTNKGVFYTITII